MVWDEERRSGYTSSQAESKISGISGTVDRLTGVDRFSRGSLGNRSQYINDAFSFLESEEEHGAYKYFDNNNELSDNYFQGSPPSSNRPPPNAHHYIPAYDSYNSSRQNYNTPEYNNNSRQSNGHVSSLPNGGYYSGGHVPYRIPSRPSEKDSTKKSLFIKIAVFVVALLLVGVIIALTVILVQKKNDDGEQTPTEYRYALQVQLNQTWDPLLGDSGNQEYMDLKSEFETAVAEVFKTRPYSKIFTNVQVISFQQSDSGNIHISSLIQFNDEDRTYTNKVPLSDVEGEIKEELPNYLSTSILGITVEEYDEVQTTTTVRPDITDPTTTPGTRYTTVRPTDPPTVEDATCIPMKEPICVNLAYANNTVSSPRSSEQFAFLSAVSGTCSYQHVERFACLAAYPECENQRFLEPCRFFCEEFKAACKVPVNCETYPNDDIESVCVLPPDYTPPPLPTLPTDMCSDQQFRCGNEERECVDLSQKCDGSRQCSDGSDEFSERAACSALPVSELTCNFNSACNFYDNEDGSDFNWLLEQPTSLSGANTGPRFDPSTLDKTGKVLLAEASGQFHGALAIYLSDAFEISSPQCLHFYYHMLGAHMGNLKVAVQYSQGARNVEWFRSGDQGIDWHKGEVTLVPGATRVRIVAERGVGYLSDIAIDDISVSIGACPNTGCSADQFTCTNGNCQDPSVVCNGKSECGDFSDEMNCNCTDQEYQCTMGMCIKYYKQCDGISDCPDNSDEQSCAPEGVAATNLNCPRGKTKCADSVCIMREWLCDGDDDCSSSDDEANCPTCNANEFKCQDNECIPDTQICDGVAQCSGGFDEFNCVDLTPVVDIGGSGSRLPLCASGLTDQHWDNEICRLANMGAFYNRTDMMMNSDQTKYLMVKTGEGSDTTKQLLSIVEEVDSCTNNMVVMVYCAEKEYGIVPSEVNNQVIGGNTVNNKNKWPWNVVIIYTTNNGVAAVICGGSIISRNHILTAAHCTDQRSPDPGRYEVLVGSTDTGSNDGQRVKVTDIKRHPQYKIFYLGNDIAIFILRDPLTFSSSINAVSLPHESQRFGPGSLVYTTGFGQTVLGGAPSSNLQELKMKIWTDADCLAADPNADSGTICAGYRAGYPNNCQGDSGAQLSSRGAGDIWYLLGVYSSSANICTQPETPSIYTRVQEFLPWIAAETAYTFECGDNELLYTTEVQCDGVSDCANDRDESSEAGCSPTIDCDFSEQYMCGYKIIANGWTRTKGSDDALVNFGPLADSTTGNYNGFYMYTSISTPTVIVSPLYNESSEHCLFFHYYLRGNDAGQFQVFLHTESDTFIPRTLVYGDVTSAEHLFIVSNDQGKWIRGRIDIPAGSYVIGFVGEQTAITGPGIGLDDVILMQGTCASIDANNHGCGDNAAVCTGAGNGEVHYTCVNENQLCNNVHDCMSGSDETSCETSKAYMCDMENINNCAILHDHTDDDDWHLIQAGIDTSNHPLTDAASNDAGHFLHLDTRLGSSTSKSSKFSIPIDTSISGIFCLSFKYIKNTDATITVSGVVASDPPEKIWEGYSITNKSDWKEGQVEIDTDTKVYTELIFEAITVESDPPPTEGFLAVDDIRFETGSCTNPDTLNNAMNT